MSSSRLPLISIVIPVFNEEKNVALVYRAVSKVFSGLGGKYAVEYVFTDNHSADGTFSELQLLAAQDGNVRVIRFNRNYGFQRSLMTAYRLASGDAAIQIDCDLQDPPELIPEFLELWATGHDVVVGLRRYREESPLLTWARRAFYVLLDKISDDRLTPNAGDFRLVDRKVLDQLRQLNHLNPYVRGLISSLAANETGIAYDRRSRQHDQSKFPVQRLFGFALDGIIAHSVLPLKLAAYFGVLASMLTCLLSGYYIFSAIAFGADWPRGFATTTVLLLFGVGLNGIFMGILGEYIGRIYQQVHQRPLTVIEQAINFPESKRVA